MKSRSTALLVVFLWLALPSPACTNLIVTKGASRDGSVMITYAADSHTRYGAIDFYPAANHGPGEMCDIYHYESWKYMGSIPEAPHTYAVIQFMNEHQVAIGETTFGGLEPLASQPGAQLDYGSLMKIGLQRSKTAREMIRVMTDLVAEYGYASGGESFSISDANEAWIMEIIGKGSFGKGAVWVARLIPDGCVSGHANQARITTFPFQKSNDWNDPARTVYHSSDVITFAREHGFYAGNDSDFSFSDVYNPVNFGGARFCDARIWSFFRKVNRSVRDNPDYTRYALGQLSHDKRCTSGGANPNGYVSNRLPLWVRVDSLIALQDVMAAMRDHFEDTPLDMRYDLGAGPFHLPYRWRPMEFTIDSVTYLNERAIATQQTGYSFVAQSRSRLPDPVGGIFWFGVDDADGCVYVPMYCGTGMIPESYLRGNGSMVGWSENSAFWTFSQVNNWAYTRYDMIHPEIELYQGEIENRLRRETEIVDTRAADLFSENPAAATRYLTDYCVYTGNLVVSKWKDFYHYLFMKYIDGNVKQTRGFEILDNGNERGIPRKPAQPGYGKEWERKMIENTGDRFKVPETK
ncbi:MAG TPA: C69 family dipeptidase [Bacteroidales bacterium]|nr:C69 family dipeptidase [Bacteroidales bacterium]